MLAQSVKMNKEFLTPLNNWISSSINSNTCHRSNSRVVVITGASRGLGAAILQRLLADTSVVYHVVTIQRSPPPPPALSSPPYGVQSEAEGECDGENVRHLQVDLSDVYHVQQVVSHLLYTLPFIDMIVNNAAAIDTDTDTTSTSTTLLLQLNFFTPLSMLCALLPRARRVVNVSSGDGELLFFLSPLRTRLESLALHTPSLAHFRAAAHDLCTRVDYDLVAAPTQKVYRLSKALLNALSRCVHRLSEGHVDIVAVCPGDVDTQMGDDVEVLLSPEEAVQKMWPVLNLSTQLPQELRGQFVRYGRRIEW